MSSFTRKAIISSFMHLAAKKPLEKITVRDIVDDCGINRNTFYYHFQDIFAVLEEVCCSGTDKIDRTLPFGEMLEHLFTVLANYATKYPKATQHIAASIGQSGAERFFAKGFDGPVYEALQEHAPTASEDMLRTATVFLRHAFIGLYVDFVNRNGKIDGVALAARIRRLANGVLSSLQ